MSEANPIWRKPFDRKAVRPMTPGRDPWAKQRGESAKAFEAFALYRDLGPGRSIREAARRLSKTPAVLSTWSNRWQWVFRVEQWDAEVDRQAMEALVKSRTDMLERHRVLAAAMLNRVMARLAGAPANQDRPVAILPLDLNQLGPQSLMDMADLAVKIGRLAHELPTEHAKVEGGGRVATTQEEALESIRAILSSPDAAERIGGLVEALFVSPGPGAPQSGHLGDPRQP